MPLRIVHVSDIHFSLGTWDEDHDQRQELVSDLRELVLRDGPIDAVLVGGDIAFSGKRAEYEIAHAWLSDLVDVCGGIDTTRVWTVPGNHDVDVAMVSEITKAQEFREAMRDCQIDSIDHELHQRVAKDSNAAAALFLPLTEYNRFAHQYLSETTPSDPHWRDSSTFDIDGWPVCLTGQNSVLNSDLLDSEEETAEGGHRLVLGKNQCRLPRQNMPVHIVMAHHPPGWIRDWEIVEPLMRRAHLRLYGHEHEYRSSQPTPFGSVSLSAGAVGPERTREGEKEPWIAAYSVITLSRTAQETLQIDVHPRTWSLSATRFVDREEGGESFQVARIPVIPEDATPPSEDSDSGNIESSAGEASPLATAPELPGSESVDARVVSRPDLRALAVGFILKPETDQIAIGRRMDLVSEPEASDAADGIGRLILKRVRETGRIGEFAKELGQ